MKNQKVDKAKRGGGAKHSDINVNAFLIQIMPECFAPTDLFVKKIFDTNQIGLLYKSLVLLTGDAVTRILSICVILILV